MISPTQIIHAITRRFPAVLPYLNKDARAVLKAAAGYDGIRDIYWYAIYDAVYDYLTGNKPVTSFRNAMGKAMADAFIDAAKIGYLDGGGELPFDDETLTWLGGAQTAELGHIGDLFARLKEEWDGLDPVDEAHMRADGYTRTLDSIYTEAKMRGSKNITLVFVGDDGKESCPECQKMKGKRHKIQYILDHNLIPRPGNNTYSCNGYNCEHYWMNPKTGERFDA
jgi:hypothetical protein